MWTTKRPGEEGHYWVVIKYFIDGKLANTTEPEVWYINPDGHYGCCGQLGTDDPQEIPDGEDLIEEVDYQREPVYCWDNEESAQQKRNDIVTQRWEYWIKPIIEPVFDEKYIDPYPVLHQEGSMSVEMEVKTGGHFGDVGIQIARDGRIWLCYNGQAFIRFKPMDMKVGKVIL